MTENTTMDAIVIGGGVAGLSAALMLGRSRRRTAVIDAGLPRNRFAAHMHGVLGHEDVAPAALLDRGRGEIAQYGVEQITGTVTGIRDTDRRLALTVDRHSGGPLTLHSRTVVLALGATDALPDIPGFAERWGVTALHCPYCHGWEVRDQRLGVLAASASHAHLALLVRQLSETVTVFASNPGVLSADDRARFSARGITVVDSPIVAVHGPGTAITTVETNAGEHVEVDAIFGGTEATPHDDLLAPLSLDRADSPMGSVIATDLQGRTSHPRIWAVGNLVVPHANVALSMGAGTMAGAGANAALAQEDAENAVRALTAWPDAAPADFWEQRYGSDGPAWSGAVNATLADAVAELAPGRSLDLGCGEGADAIHLALAGWDAHGVDISPTAIQRARDTASTSGASATFEAADLATWEADGDYDLVTASFLHSPAHLDRTMILRRASAAVAPGGHLLLVTHASAPPWADPEHVRHHTFLSARQEVDALGLGPEDWEEVRVEEVRRETRGPDGAMAFLTDGLVLLRRR